MALGAWLLLFQNPATIPAGLAACAHTTAAPTAILITDADAPVIATHAAPTALLTTTPEACNARRG